MSHGHDVPPHPAVIDAEEAAMTRRVALKRFGGAGLGLAALGGLGGAVLLGSGGATEGADAASCRLAPQTTEGPFFLDVRKLRRDITEGRPGARLDLRLKVIDAGTCRPLDDVAVDVWHADARGRYSGIASEGTRGMTYLRGIQLTDARGLATLRTIYPGSYPGRAVHLHLSAYVGGREGATYVGGRTAHTGQLYFPDAVTDRVLRLGTYASRGRRTRNRQDGIYAGEGGSTQVLKVQRRGSSDRSGFTATITLAIDAGL